LIVLREKKSKTGSVLRVFGRYPHTVDAFIRIVIIIINNNLICIAPYGRDVIGAGCMADTFSWPKCLIKQVGFSLDLKDVSESAAVTMFGREFQVVGCSAAESSS